MQARYDELVLAHTEAHVRHIDGPPKGDEWQIGDNYYSAATPLAARTAAGCTVQVACYSPHQHAIQGRGHRGATGRIVAAPVSLGLLRVTGQIVKAHCGTRHATEAPTGAHAVAMACCGPAWHVTWRHRCFPHMDVASCATSRGLCLLETALGMTVCVCFCTGGGCGVQRAGAAGVRGGAAAGTPC